MPAPHRLAQLHSLGGKYAEEAEGELRRALDQHGSVAKAAEALGTSDKSVWRWISAWGMSLSKKDSKGA
jgi:molybdenum-dependent DNA-binding transcriptional regulator ModE